MDLHEWSRTIIGKKVKFKEAWNQYYPELKLLENNQLLKVSDFKTCSVVCAFSNECPGKIIFEATLPYCCYVSNRNELGDLKLIAIIEEVEPSRKSKGRLLTPAW